MLYVSCDLFDIYLDRRDKTIDRVKFDYLGVVMAFSLAFYTVKVFIDFILIL